MRLLRIRPAAFLERDSTVREKWVHGREGLSWSPQSTGHVFAMAASGRGESGRQRPEPRPLTSPHMHVFADAPQSSARPQRSSSARGSRPLGCP